jgi:DNA-damage-inducible protein D
VDSKKKMWKSCLRPHSASLIVLESKGFSLSISMAKFMNYDEIINGFEAAKKISPNGTEFWEARTLQKLLEYVDWRNFHDVMERAAVACKSVGIKPENHFVGFTNMVAIGSGAKRKYDDFWLSRFACYLIAMNGDPSNERVAAAQQYFAIKTREQEIGQKYLNAQERVKLRDRIRIANKHLAGSAASAGVKEFGLFQHAGYLGFYNMGADAVKQLKGILPKEELLDRIGRLELSAHEFRINLTKEALNKNNVRDEKTARNTHSKISSKVRATIHEETGVFPENLKAEPSIKKIVSASKKKHALPQPPGTS